MSKNCSFKKDSPYLKTHKNNPIYIPVTIEDTILF